MKFSGRFPSDLQPNQISACIERKRRAGIPILDLTLSNPTRAGFQYPESEILQALSLRPGLEYDPDPRGLERARDAVAGYYSRRGIQVDPSHLILTASTSEAYALLFKVLCDPGNEVLVPRPSYPLFDHLARAECVTATAYDLVYHGSWRIDFETLEAKLTDNVRAIVVVSPNNPTGSILTAEELDRLANLSAASGVAILCDEVFADYCFTSDPQRVGTVADFDRTLVFALNGLSKIAGLPQVKLGWIGVNGPNGVRREALQRLEFAADLFLSVASPVQHGAAALLELADPIQSQILDRVQDNDRFLRSLFPASSGCTVLNSEGGWYAVVRYPNVVPEEQLVLELLETHDVLVHPGYFFDFARPGYLIVSLLPQTEPFRAGCERIRDYTCGSAASSGRVSPA